jgi:hypothetical protein
VLGAILEQPERPHLRRLGRHGQHGEPDDDRRLGSPHLGPDRERFHDEVAQVLGVPDSDVEEEGLQLRGPGAILSFEVAGGRAAAAALVGERARELHGISDGLLRLSVGLEDPEDLWADLERGLAAAAGPRARLKAV